MLPEETLWPEDLIGLERKDWTLGRLLEEKARRNKGETFLLFENENISFDQFNEMANRAANGLLNLGIRKGHKVAIMLPNCPD